MKKEKMTVILMALVIGMVTSTTPTYALQSSGSTSGGRLGRTTAYYSINDISRDSQAIYVFRMNTDHRVEKMRITNALLMTNGGKAIGGKSVTANETFSASTSITYGSRQINNASARYMIECENFGTFSKTLRLNND